MAVFYYDMALILIHYDHIVVVVLSVDDASSDFILNFGFNNFMTFIDVEAAISNFGASERLGFCIFTFKNFDLFNFVIFILVGNFGFFIRFGYKRCCCGPVSGGVPGYHLSSACEILV